jgi:hypothetical protein
MAVRYAVATGNWSNTATWNSGTLPTSADDVYSNGFMVTIDQDVTVLSISNTAQSPAVAGGGFILNNGVTVTCTSTGNGILIGATTLLTYSGTGSVVINGNFGGITANSINGFLISGAGNITINGTINASTSNANTNTINVTAAAILNVNGNVKGFATGVGSANAIRMNTSGGVLNFVGNIEVRGTIKQVVSMLAGTTLNMTGDILCQLSTANSGVGVDANAATINITGNLSITNAISINNVNWYCLGASNICTINIIGTISNDLTANAMTFSYPVGIFSTSYFNHIGSVIGGLRAPAIYNLVAGAINILTGPFISSPNAILPLLVTRMNYRKTMGSYFEFRDSSTNGALPPSTEAPATRLVSPDTVVDAPIPANVRNGVVYALGSLTGTLKVPSPNSVAFGVLTDNTTGLAVLTPEDVWNAQTSVMNTAGSIGNRLKNTATVDSTGDQIAALL